PETGHAVDKFVSFVVPNESTFAAHKFDEVVFRWFGERVQKRIAGLIHNSSR
ncbi:MAG: hypothetical protein RLZZ534_825, partial [Actinomycetota bacterium]